jgi:cell division septal protein FtsQ
MSGNPAILDIETPRAGLLRHRRRNRRIAIQRRSLWIMLAGASSYVWRVGIKMGREAGKLLLLLAAIAVCIWGGRWAIGHVVDSPRFQLKGIEFAVTPHLGQAEIMDLSGVTVGDKLLGIDTDAVAARIASHPWVASVRVSRRLPSSLIVDVTERHAVAAAALAGLYLVDDSGRPFKRASMDEADGLPVLTGIERGRYAQMREVSEAAFREVLGLLRDYRSKSGRPPVGEVNIDPRFGFSLFLLEGGTEIRLGRGKYGKKLAQLDQIFEAVVAKQMGGLPALRIVHLDLPESGRIPVLLRGGDEELSIAPKSAPVKLGKI